MVVGSIGSGSILRRLNVVRVLGGNPFCRAWLHWVGMGPRETISVYRRCGIGCVFRT